MRIYLSYEDQFGNFIQYQTKNNLADAIRTAKIKSKQIKNASIDSLLEFQDARHYVQWAGLGAMAEVASGELTDKEAFEKLAKSVRVVDIPQKQRDAIIKRIIKKKHPWETKDSGGK